MLSFMYIVLATVATLAASSLTEDKVLDDQKHLAKHSAIVTAEGSLADDRNQYLRRETAVQIMSNIGMKTKAAIDAIVGSMKTQKAVVQAVDKSWQDPTCQATIANCKHCISPTYCGKCDNQHYRLDDESDPTTNDCVTACPAGKEGVNNATDATDDITGDDGWHCQVADDTIRYDHSVQLAARGGMPLEMPNHCVFGCFADCANCSHVPEQPHGSTSLFDGRIETGPCPNFLRGSQQLGYKEMEGYFHTSTLHGAIHASVEACATICENDPTCEQAQYHTGGLCELGIQGMDETPCQNLATGEHCDNSVFCFGRHGFDYTNKVTRFMTTNRTDHKHMKPGQCPDFFEGYLVESVESDTDAAAAPELYPFRCQCRNTQCDKTDSLIAQSGHHYEWCSHWNGMQQKTRDGCFGLCHINPHCRAAEYDEETHDCKISVMEPSWDPSQPHGGWPMGLKSRYIDSRTGLHSKTVCHAKYGFGNSDKTESTSQGVNTYENITTQIGVTRAHLVEYLARILARGPHMHLHGHHYAHNNAGTTTTVTTTTAAPAALLDANADANANAAH